MIAQWSDGNHKQSSSSANTTVRSTLDSCTLRAAFTSKALSRIRQQSPVLATVADFGDSRRIQRIVASVDRPVRRRHDPSDNARCGTTVRPFACSRVVKPKGAWWQDNFPCRVYSASKSAEREDGAKTEVRLPSLGVAFGHHAFFLSIQDDQ